MDFEDGTQFNFDAVRPNGFALPKPKCFKPTVLTRQRQIPGRNRSFDAQVIVDRLEQRRGKRIARAHQKKIDKLLGWTRLGARTVLIFEDQDIQLTNAATVVTEAYLNCFKKPEDRPNETYLVSTHHDPWWVTPLLIGSASFIEPLGFAIWTIDKLKLCDVLRR